ncbi:hypothetical protein [Paenibacillus methanolicus]|uniref:Uncharacterized protein n=1 Tax=Paenibacillus methanolicus TaxID=582686 RepID=A0A5S5CHL7_9BACL|nr:hypothetical protein [Paenibacillus methanolicus]TYP79289.1 hypothetical protein BCM02_101407 [Paenibacillus methanolicus]
MADKKLYYAFEDPSGTAIEFRATSLQQAMVIKKKKAEKMGLDKDVFALTSIHPKTDQRA